MGIAENGFRQLTNSVREIKSVDDMKNVKIRVAGSNLLMECYKRWGADATNMNWSETYTALQQKTVEGQENPLSGYRCRKRTGSTAILLPVECKL